MTSMVIISLVLSCLSFVISCFLLFSRWRVIKKRNKGNDSELIASLDRRTEKILDDFWQLSNRVRQQSERIKYLESMCDEPVVGERVIENQESHQLSKREEKEEKYGNKKKNRGSHQISSSSNHNKKATKPTNVEYTLLTVVDRKLVPQQLGQTAYYRCWHDGGKIWFEFSCDSSKVKKVILNRDSIIAPCCVKDVNSLEPNDANDIETIEFGELDSNYQIISKSTIKYI